MEGNRMQPLITVEVYADGSIILIEKDKKCGVKEVNIAMDPRNNLVIRTVEDIDTGFSPADFGAKGMFQEHSVIKTTVIRPETITKYGMPKQEVNGPFIFDPNAVEEFDKTMPKAIETENSIKE